MYIDPRRDVLDIAKMFSAAESDIREDLKQLSIPVGGTPIFVKEDVFAATDKLTRLIRYIFVKLNITNEQLTELYREYSYNMSELPSRFSSNVSNLKSSLMRDSVSFKTVYRAIELVLGYEIRLDIKLQRPGGEQYTFSTEDIK